MKTQDKHQGPNSHAAGRHSGGNSKGYGRFILMVAVATMVMFGLSYLTAYSFDHVFFSETRTYMSMAMGAVMAVVMLGFMLNMYKSRPANLAILAGSAVLFVVALWLARSQGTVQDVSWMKAMIPHHSIAILTSERAQISDPRVKKLAETIVETQRKEIAEMKALIEDLERGGGKGGAQPRQN